MGKSLNILLISKMTPIILRRSFENINIIVIIKKAFKNFDKPKASPKNIDKIINSLNSKDYRALIRIHLN